MFSSCNYVVCLYFKQRDTWDVLNICETITICKLTRVIGAGMKCRHMFSLQGSWRWGPFTNPDNLIRETDARDPRAGLLLGITEGDSTHKDKWEGGLDGLDGFTTAVTRSETDSRLESKQERETEFYDGWRLYQRVTGGMCLVFSECTCWPLPTGHAIPLLKIEALTKWDTYHLAKWRGEKTWQYMRLEKCPNPTYWIKLVHVILDELCLMFSEHSGKVLSKLRTNILPLIE